MIADEYPKYYDTDMDGVPVRQLTAKSVPEVYRGNCKWETYVDPERIGNYGKSLNADEFDELIAVLDGKPGRPKKGK